MSSPGTCQAVTAAGKCQGQVCGKRATHGAFCAIHRSVAGLSSRPGSIAVRQPSVSKSGSSASEGKEKSSPTCPAVTADGKRKGSVCGRPSLWGAYCGNHKALALSPPGPLTHAQLKRKAAALGFADQPVPAEPGAKATCKAVNAKGQNAGLICGRPASSCGYCGFHKSKHARVELARASARPSMCPTLLPPPLPAAVSYDQGTLFPCFDVCTDSALCTAENLSGDCERLECRSPALCGEPFCAYHNSLGDAVSESSDSLLDCLDTQLLDLECLF